MRSNSAITIGTELNPEQGALLVASLPAQQLSLPCHVYIHDSVPLQRNHVSNAARPGEPTD